MGQESQSRPTARLVENVRADRRLTPGERETMIRWDGADDENATVYSEERGIILSILRSPVAMVHTLRVSDDDRFGAMVPPDEYSQGKITGVQASVPIGAIKIKCQSRSTAHRSKVVSDHDPEE